MRRLDVDALACQLASWGRIARRLPPSWRYAGDAQPLAGPDGTVMGLMQPGRGLQLSADLNRMGITRSIPNVFERTPFMRAVEFWMDEAAAITSLADIRSQRAAGQGQDCFFVLPSAHVDFASGTWWDTNFTSGPGGNNYTAIPGSSAPDRTNANALNFAMTDPPSGLSAFLIRIGIAAADAGVTTDAQKMYVWSDLLVECGNILGSSTASQTLGTTALTRYTSGAGVLPMLDSIDGGTGPVTFTFNYTNQAGTTGRSTSFSMASPNTADSASSDPDGTETLTFPLQAGDYGVRAVASVQFSASLGAGTHMALNLFKPLVYMPGLCLSNEYYELDLTTFPIGLVPLATTSGGKVGCITCYMLSNGTNRGDLVGSFSTVWG